jgi:hypothetical protein
VHGDIRPGLNIQTTQDKCPLPAYQRESGKRLTIPSLSRYLLYALCIDFRLLHHGLRGLGSGSQELGFGRPDFLFDWRETAKSLRDLLSNFAGLDEGFKLPVDVRGIRLLTRADSANNDELFVSVKAVNHAMLCEIVLPKEIQPGRLWPIACRFSGGREGRSRRPS